MNSLTTRRLSRGIASTFAAAGIAAAIGTPLNGLAATPNQLGTPNDGMICRGGYTPIFNGTSLKCSKVDTPNLAVALICDDPQFPKYVVRGSAGGTPNGLDVCTKNKNDPGFVAITATSDISTLVKTKDYVFAKADLAQIAVKTAARAQAEATALGLPVNEVEAEGTEPVTNTTAGGSDDKSNVTLTFFTFPIKTLGIVIGTPGPLTSTTPFASTPFVPRALPR
ncbi:MAG: hypothetical protein ABI702_17460 [Burkholderiales bacterium]